MVRLEEFTTIRAPLEQCYDLARSVQVHLAGNARFGETVVPTEGVASGLLSLGQRVTWRAKHLGFWQTLTSEITAMDRPVYFQDTMVQGAFRWMQHDHFFRQLSADYIEMKDVFCFEAPFGLLGRLAEVALLGRYMRALLRDRNAMLREIAEAAA